MLTARSSAPFAVAVWVTALLAIAHLPGRAQATPRFEESLCPFKADARRLRSGRLTGPNQAHKRMQSAALRGRHSSFAQPRYP